jgi:hypothetical protein
MMRKKVTGGPGVPSTKMAGRPTPLAGRPWFVIIRPPTPVARAGHHLRAKVPLVPKAMEHYGDPRSMEGDRSASTCGPFE